MDPDEAMGEAELVEVPDDLDEAPPAEKKDERTLLQKIMASGDLVVVALIAILAGGVMSGALLARDFLTSTDLKNASSAAAIDGFSKQQGRLNAEVDRWKSAAVVQQEALIKALEARPEAAVRVAAANTNASRVLEASALRVSPTTSTTTATRVSTSDVGKPPPSVATSILAFCAAEQGCRAYPELVDAFTRVMVAERALAEIDSAIATRRQALADIDSAIKGFEASAFYPDGALLAKREVRYALEQWTSYRTNWLLALLLNFATAPIFILNLALCGLMGASGASISYLLVRIDPKADTPNFVITLMLGALASATIFLIYSTGLGLITVSSSASLSFPDPLFVTGVSLVAGFNAKTLMSGMGAFAGRVFTPAGAG